MLPLTKCSCCPVRIIAPCGDPLGRWSPGLFIVKSQCSSSRETNETTVSDAPETVLHLHLFSTAQRDAFSAVIQKNKFWCPAVFMSVSACLCLVGEEIFRFFTSVKVTICKSTPLQGQKATKCTQSIKSKSTPYAAE